MNNKGQVLIVFVLLLPILIFLFALIIDLGLLLDKTNTIKKNIVEVIEYGLDSNEEDKDKIMKQLLELNLGNDNQYVVSSYGNIRIEVKGEYKSIFTKIIKNNYKYSYTYIGYIENEKKVIKKEG